MLQSAYRYRSFSWKNNNNNNNKYTDKKEQRIKAYIKKSNKYKK